MKKTCSTSLSLMVTVRLIEASHARVSFITSLLAFLNLICLSISKFTALRTPPILPIFFTSVRVSKIFDPFGLTDTLASTRKAPSFQKKKTLT